MKKFNGNDIINAIKEIYERGEGIDSHYGNNVSHAVERFDIASMNADYDECLKYWKQMTNEERLLVMTVDLHPLIEKVKSGAIDKTRLAEPREIFNRVMSSPYYFGFLDLEGRMLIPEEFVEWFCGEIAA